MFAFGVKNNIITFEAKSIVSRHGHTGSISKLFIALPLPGGHCCFLISQDAIQQVVVSKWTQNQLANVTYY
jgi:hypothetical protein